MALGALEAARAAGRRVPSDLSIVGFDDIPFAALANPPLTTVGQPIRQLGEQAADLLLAVIEHGARLTVDQHTHPNVLLPNELIVRQSTAPPSVSRFALGFAPITWNNEDLRGELGPVVDYDTVLDEIVAAGYVGHRARRWFST